MIAATVVRARAHAAVSGGCRASERVAIAVPTVYAHPERLEDQYRQLSARLGTEVFLQEGLVNYFGYTFLNTYSEIDKAILCFQLNTRHYPRSADAWASLGEAYAAAGNRAMAIESYTKSLELDPANSNAARQLDKLRGQAPSQK